MRKVIAILFIIITANGFAQLDVKPTSRTTVKQILSIVDTMPQFPGGDSAMTAFINKNLNYKKKNKAKQEDEQPSGSCLINFVVEKTGRITSAKIVKGIKYAPDFDAECLRVINSMPYWIPGKNNGKTVRVSYNYSIKYKEK